jgi:hypothetical protein
MVDKIERVLINALVWCFLGLGSANVFFIKRLVDKIDSTEKLVSDLGQTVSVLKYAIDHLRYGKTRRDNEYENGN